MSPSWSERVSFSPDNVYAYAPGEILIRPRDGAQNADDIGTALAIINRIIDRSRERVGTEPPRPVIDEETWVGFRRIRGAGPWLQIDVVQAVSELRRAGIQAQPNHVLFADPFSGNPFSGNPFSGNPFSGNPFSGNPFSGNPFSGNPFSGNPFSGNPFSGNPFSGNPAGAGLPGDFCYGKPAPSRDHEFARTGQGPCLARPAERSWPTGRPALVGGGWPAVAVLDVAFPEPGQVPSLVGGCDVVPAGLHAVADEDPPGTDGHGFLDRVAGHGLFVAGRIAQVDPDCHISVHGALSNAGDGSEWQIARILSGLAGSVDVVNLSFGGYALDHMDCVQAAISLLQTTAGPASDRVGAGAPFYDHGCVVVTSAGNDATSIAPYPAAFPGVVSVAALGPAGPASFTNYGDWVSACASGVDVASTYFTHFDGKTVPDPMSDPDRFRGAATWSGTSFAAPLVAGKIARLVREQELLPKQAVRRLLDGPDLARLPYLGTVVTD